jgi:APA family basic amino acid/polyamine antiporter
VPPPDHASPTLLRTLDLKALSAGLFNTVVGAGIFVLPATVAGLVGTGAAFAYVFCAVAILFVMLAYASAGSRVTDAGGSIAYIHAAFGPLAGFLGGVMIWLSDTLAAGGVAAAFAAAVAVYVPVAGDPIGRALLLAVVLGGLAAINVRGAATGARFVQVVTIFKLAPLLAFIVLGLALRSHDIPAPTIPAAGALGRAAVFLMFAFSGAETSMALSGEVVDAHKTIPRALLLALGIITLLYGSVHAVAAALLGSSLPAASAAPLADAAALLGGAPMRSLLLAGTAISMFGYMSAIALATPRSVYRIGRAGVLPRALGSVHPRFRTPHVAIVGQALVTFSIAATGTFTLLVPLATVAVLVLYLTVCLAAWRLARLDVRAEGEPFTVPSPVFAIGVLLCLWLLWNTTLKEQLLELAVLSAAAILFLWRTRGRDAEAVAAGITEQSA